MFSSKKSESSLLLLIAIGLIIWFVVLNVKSEQPNNITYSKTINIGYILSYTDNYPLTDDAIGLTQGVSSIIDEKWMEFLKPVANIKVISNYLGTVKSPCPNSCNPQKITYLYYQQHPNEKYDSLVIYCTAGRESYYDNDCQNGEISKEMSYASGAHPPFQLFTNNEYSQKSWAMIDIHELTHILFYCPDIYTSTYKGDGCIMGITGGYYYWDKASYLTNDCSSCRDFINKYVST